MRDRVDGHDDGGAVFEKRVIEPLEFQNASGHVANFVSHALEIHRNAAHADKRAKVSSSGLATSEDGLDARIHGDFVAVHFGIAVHDRSSLLGVEFLQGICRLDKLLAYEPAHGGHFREHFFKIAVIAFDDMVHDVESFLFNRIGR